MNFPEDYHYSKEHEWAKIDGNTITVGITDHAQSSLGDVVFLELPEVGRELQKGETFGVVESVKAVSDLYSPFAGKVSEINSDLVENPSLVNDDPHGKAWLLKLEASDPSQTGELMDVKQYEEYVNTLA